MVLKRMVCIIGVVAAVAALAGLVGFRLWRNHMPTDSENAQIVSFSFSHSGSSTFEFYTYDVVKNEESGKMEANYDLFCELLTYNLPADSKLMEGLSEIVDAYGLRKWNGFNKSSSMVQDGYGFDLHVGFDNGSSITASGSNRFPEGYDVAESAINDLFRGYLKKQGIDLDDLI